VKNQEKNFVDEDGDGICDNSANGDGNEYQNRNQNQTRNQQKHGEGNCQGNCNRTPKMIVGRKIRPHTPF